MGGINLRKFGIALVAGCSCLAASPGLAQLSDTGEVIGNPDVDSGQLERSCDAGDMQSCKLLGDAYANGQEVPRVAEVARILFTQACDADLAEACNALGELYLDRLSGGSTDENLVLEYHSGMFPSFEKACRLESKKGCENLAVELQTQPEITRYNTMLGAICEAGDLGTCTQLAILRLEQDRSSADRVWSFAMLDAQCRALNRQACEEAARNGWKYEIQGDPRFPVWLEILCDLRFAYRCEERAKLAMPDGLREENREEVLRFLDKSCAIDQFSCWLSDRVHEIARLEPQCLFGDYEACGQWGRHLISEPHLTPSPVTASNLVEGACLYGAPEYCVDAVSLIDETTDMSDAAAVDHAIMLREAACQGGVSFPCLSLADWYIEGEFVAQSPERAVEIVDSLCALDDRDACFRLAEWHFAGEHVEKSVERGVTLIDGLCVRGDADSCTRLGQWYRDGIHVVRDFATSADYFDRACRDPDHSAYSMACVERDRLAVVLPDRAIVVAGSDFEPILPPLTPEEQAELLEIEECITHWAIFRGVSHSELQCPPMEPRGRLSEAIRASRAPWQAMIWRPERVDGTDLTALHRVECGGTLIKKGWILTAAHCVQDKDLRELGYKIRMSVSNPAGREGFEYEILDTIPHPWFKRLGYAFDIALLRYDHEEPKIHSWPYSPAAAALDPKSMEERSISEDMKVYAYGWGWTEVENSSATEYLQSIPMNLATLDDCEELTNYTDEKRKNAVLCAAGNSGAQTCFGDSGGGLFYYGDGTGPVLIGVVSAGKACGTTGLDSRYPRVAKFRDWIEKQIAKHERGGRRSGRR